MRVSFRERNPVPIGLTGFAVIIVLVLLALNLESIPFVIERHRPHRLVQGGGRAWSPTRRSASPG